MELPSLPPLSSYRSKASKARRDPFTLSIYEIDQMIGELQVDLPHPKAVEGHVKTKGTMFRTSMYYISADLYYKHLLDMGLGKKLEANGIINVETLVSQFGAW